MIIMRIKDGLGNQLFQYAVAWALSKRLKQPFILHVDELKEIRPFRLAKLNVQIKSVVSTEKLPSEIAIIKSEHVNNALKNLGITKYQFGNWLYLRQHQDEFQKDFLTVDAENIYLDGWFQCESYFKSYREDLITQFKPSYSTECRYLQTLDQIRSCNSVAIHVRCGDFRLSRHPFHYLLTEDYYRRAIAYIRERVSLPFFSGFLKIMSGYMTRLAVKMISVL